MTEQRRTSPTAQSDLRATTAALRIELLGPDWTHDDTSWLMDTLVGCASGRALMRRRLAEHGSCDCGYRHDPTCDASRYQPLSGPVVSESGGRAGCLPTPSPASVGRRRGPSDIDPQ